MRFLLGLVLAFALSPAWAAPLTAEQEARCAAQPIESYRNACRAAYASEALRLPDRAEEATSSRSGMMAILKPRGAGPFPAIVLMHTCGPIDADQMRYWTRAAVERGYVAFVLDSFTQRGAQQGTCDWRGDDMRFAVYPTRTRDAYDALRHLASLPFVDRNRVFALGFSQGGRIAYTLAGARYAQMFGAGLRFRAVASVYGRCRNPVTQRWWPQNDSATPLLSLLGGKDADGDASECVPLFEKMKTAGLPVEWHVYPNAAHCWDYAQYVPGRQVPLWGVAGNTVRYEYDPRVADDSRERVFAFFAR
ncbi:MAG: dienelactone hydrolase family protein [Alphaproteobacteria bacterium]|nr:dienelactone hydrolase family protein [Alphaproteobacteria bacterium]